MAPAFLYLDTISSGVNPQSQIEAFIDEKSIGGQLNKVEKVYEVYIVAMTLDHKKVLLVEVKRQKKNFKPQVLKAKIEVFNTKVLNKYGIDWTCLDSTDM